MAKTSSAGKFALGEDVQHLAADIAGRADDGDFITHDALLCPFAGRMYGKAARM